jgi:hypothetical protein
MACAATIDSPVDMTLARPSKKKSKFEFSNNDNSMDIIPPAFKAKPSNFSFAFIVNEL